MQAPIYYKITYYIKTPIFPVNTTSEVIQIIFKNHGPNASTNNLQNSLFNLTTHSFIIFTKYQKLISTLSTKLLTLKAALQLYIL